VSDDHEFALLAESLRNEGFGRRVVLVDRLRRFLWLVAGILGLLALAVMLALTGTMSIVITLVAVGLVVYELIRVGLREHKRDAS
jgi:lipopolysaccharide/colanic/teichoic acid biosynthesis glycosyltransferase